MTGDSADYEEDYNDFSEPEPKQTWQVSGLSPFVAQHMGIRGWEIVEMGHDGVLRTVALVFDEQLAQEICDSHNL